MVEKTFNLTWNNHLANLSGLFEELYKNGILTDTTLACQDGILKAHKLVLAACSPYFERVFKEHYGDQPILILKGVPMEEMECLLHFMYRGSIDVTEENLPSLISIATELEIRGLSADHQSEISNAYFNMKQDNSKSQKLNYTHDTIANSNNLRSDDSNSAEHVKVEEVEVEDDPMILDNPEDNFEDSLPLASKCMDLLTKTDEESSTLKQNFDKLKREKICRNTEELLRIDKKQHKPYSCDLCTLAFTRASHLARHRRVHTGERPFACTLCPRMFARQDKLKQHLDSHLQWHQKRTIKNESSTKLVPVKNKRGRPRKVTVEQSAFEEILKFGEFSSMLNKSQAMKAKNNDKIETRGKSCTSDNTETTTLKMKDNYVNFGASKATTRTTDKVDRPLSRSCTPKNK
ncbi:zinc finger and BTB domain-containing protein 24-like isoform X1 [Leptopilina boulardi]|uniref:zinc finger and BTB domain-containing protein 24-like isoform X1 n=1 Tax=Leptopilina boulardi TaxID=63433 RepID=UPI0021F530CA|nr:zinc finger and BTB domain-containing protein 24-like isoform X1 [Leptopilina boulardi]